MNNVEKLPSGSYRYKKKINGQLIRATFDHKPSDLEISMLIAEKAHVIVNDNTQNFYQAALQYIKSKSNILSPTTIKSYESIVKNMSLSFKRLKLSDITSVTVQNEVNNYSVNHSSKSTKNYSGFISSVLGLFRPDLVIRVTLPHKEQKRSVLPSYEEIQALLDAVKDTEYSIPFQLGVLGLRRSEVCALTLNDLDGNILTINKAKIKDLQNKWIIKPFTKTDESTREIVIPDSLAEEIRQKGYIYNGSPDTLGRRIHTIQDQNNLPRFKLHSLRHFFVSYAHSQGIPDAYIQKMGGWTSNSDVMKKVYRETMDDTNREMQKKIGSLLL